MSTHVGKCTVAVFAVSSPCGEVIVHIIRAKNLIESTHGCGPKPCIPIYALGSRFSGQIAGLGGTAHAYSYLFELTNSSAAYHLYGSAKFSSVFRSLLATRLKNNSVIFHRIGHGTPFLDGKRYWFFTVHVLFGPCGTNCGLAMPMIGCGDKHGIEDLSSELKVVLGDIEPIPFISRCFYNVFRSVPECAWFEYRNFSKAGNGRGIADQFVGMIGHIFPGPMMACLFGCWRGVTLGRPYVGRQ